VLRYSKNQPWLFERSLLTFIGVMHLRAVNLFEALAIANFIAEWRRASVGVTLYNIVSSMLLIVSIRQ
jgi:hypothetical protein